MQTTSNQNSFSQNGEDLLVLNYFGGYKGNLLEIGANEGEFLSNSKLLIDSGWSAHLVEPGETYKKLVILHNGNENVHTYKVGIGECDLNKVKFFESGCHIPNGEDKGLVSTFNFDETKRWPDVKFKESSIDMVSWKTFYNKIGKPKLDFISIDVEGLEWAILKQIDLYEVGCKCLCIEFNSDSDKEKLFSNYCAFFGLTNYTKNAENLIFVK